MIPEQRSPAAVVLDASVIVDVLTGTERAAAVSTALLGGQALHAPDLLELEVTSALRRIELDGGLTGDRARQVFADLAGLDVQRHPIGPLNERVWSLREWVRVADGYYVALAEVLRAPLMTGDRRLARALRERGLIDVIEPEKSP